MAMKAKIHWGYAIAGFFVLFILFLAFNLIFSSMQKSELVSGDYYQKGVAYQQQIDKEERTKKLPQQIKISQDNESLVLLFPSLNQSAEIGGEILFYRPSNNNLDKKIQIKVNEENKQIIDTKNFIKGLWKLKINWSEDNIEYYYEETINL